MTTSEVVSQTGLLASDEMIRHYPVKLCTAIYAVDRCRKMHPSTKELHRRNP